MKTLTVDDSKRIRLPDAKPRQVYSYEPGSDGSIRLVPVAATESGQASVRIEKRGRYSVGVLGQPIDPRALAEALAEFP